MTEKGHLEGTFYKISPIDPGLFGYWQCSSLDCRALATHEVATLHSDELGRVNLGHQRLCDEHTKDLAARIQDIHPCKTLHGSPEGR